ncbi:EcsC family protein [Streptomyces sp. AD2-2]|nr:EcsC family protein [Streptomyces sp. AD2-2]
MTGSTPPWKRRSRRSGADEGPTVGPHGARDDERGSSDQGSASLEPAANRADLPVPANDPAAAPVAKRRAAVIRDKAREGVRKGGSRARAGLAYLADRIIDIAPRIPVRDLEALRRQFPGLGPEQLADKLVAGAANATSTVGAGIGAAAMLPVPPAMPTELAAEITGVAAIELKLIAELYEVYGVRPPGDLRQRSVAYLNSWSGERGIDVTKPSTMSTALNGHMKRELRQQIMKRMVRDLPNLMPFMVGAAVGAVMNRRDTKKLAERIRKDLRKDQVPWDALPQLPPLEAPPDPLRMGEIPKELGY